MLPAEMQTGRQHNNIGDLLKFSTSISEDDPNLQIEFEFRHDADSAILVRERARGFTSIEPAFRRERGRIISESTDTLHCPCYQPSEATPRSLSKRNFAYAHQQTDKQKPRIEQNASGQQPIRKLPPLTKSYSSIRTNHRPTACLA